jgi:hypothetical protein
MKFECGPTAAERIAAEQEWHPSFAWFPIRVGSHDCRWLERIERRAHYSWGGRWWEYRAPTGGDA